jgi:hypothetical protein
MFRLYRDVLVLAVRRTAQSWLAAVSIPIYGLILLFAAQLLSGWGFVGGLLLSLVAMACFAGYLFLLSEGVAGSKIQLADIKRGMSGMWSVCSVAFLLMILGFVVAMLASAAGPKKEAVNAIALLAMAFFLNVLPELLYTSRNNSVGLLKESADFVMANPFAWFAPNLVFALGVLALASPELRFDQPAHLLVGLASLASPAVIGRLIDSVPIWAIPLVIIAFHFMMVFRGLLFRELTTSSSRMRAFRAQF